MRGGTDKNEMLRITLAGILPQHDRRSHLVYAVLAAMIPFTYLILYVTGVRMAGTLVQQVQLLACLPIFVAWMLRRAGHTIIASGIETTTLMFVKGSFILVLQYAMITFPFPYADDWLLAADRQLWFDWLTFARFFNDPISFEVLTFAYVSMNWQATILLVILCLARRETRAWQVLTASVLALVATILIFPFFPADGRHILCGLDAPDIPVMKGMCDFSSTMHLIKYGGVRVIQTSMLAGMVSFPSFHASAALLLVWGAWDIKWIRIPFVILNGLMLIATIVVGGHYLIDIVGGLAVAAAAIWIAVKYVQPRRSRQRQGLEPDGLAPVQVTSPLLR